jgi:sortase A
MPDHRRRLRFAARAALRRAQEGDPVGRLRADAIGLAEVVVHGAEGETLRSGPGHYPDTPLPGARGTVAIAGHRSTYGAPFRDVDELEPGDRIELRMPYGSFSYRVERTRIVAPTAIWVTRRVSYDRLVLTACHPRFSAAERIVVFARLERSDPTFGS